MDFFFYKITSWQPVHRLVCRFGKEGIAGLHLPASTVLLTTAVSLVSRSRVSLTFETNWIWFSNGLTSGSAQLSSLGKRHSICTLKITKENYQYLEDCLLDVPDVNLHLQVLNLHTVLLLGKFGNALDNHVPQSAPVRPAGLAQYFHCVLSIHHRVPEDHPHRHQSRVLVVAHGGNVDIAHSWQLALAHF